MLFNSLAFAIFLPVVTVTFHLLPRRWAWLWLLGSSIYFYACLIPAYVFVLGGVVLVDYRAGIQIENATAERKKLWLCVSLAANLGVLAFFKYYQFLDQTIDSLSHALGWNYSPSKLKLLLPLGLSFHTFQSMSYIIEVYRGRQKAERHLGYYGLYVMYFPQLVAGPIERPQNLLHQLRDPAPLSDSLLSGGFRLLLLGFFKKLVIADRLAPLLQPVFSNPHSAEGGALVLATMLFSIQIYCDFSGYTDIARGTSRLMGIDLMRNFNAPYLASSVRDFWRRWHISLSTWFREYLFLPLGGSRVSHRHFYYTNLIIVFGLSGLWHGAAGHYLVWGLFHAGYMIFSDATSLLRQGIARCMHQVVADGSALTKLVVGLVIILGIFGLWQWVHGGFFGSPVAALCHAFDWSGDLARKRTGYVPSQLLAVLLIITCVVGLSLCRRIGIPVRRLLR
ncbi:MAG: alginate O-acetyltransferase, partial [Verrucomicrobiaceae bacterium]|nr:alginate O-acetyltransferase [Verrucomicrobiaceae bacterium]